MKEVAHAWSMWKVYEMLFGLAVALVLVVVAGLCCWFETKK